jgi:hypothetical protein
MSQPKESNLASRLRMKQSASCQCMTKTNDYKYHATDCLYRVLEEAIIAITPDTEDVIDRSVGRVVGYVGIDALESLDCFTKDKQPSSIRLYNEVDLPRKIMVPVLIANRSKVKPFGYFHELLDHEGKENGVFLGTYDKKVTEQSYIEGEVSPVVFALYKE